MNSTELGLWLRRYGEAWTSRDPDAAAKLFSEAAAYYETPFDPPLMGREAIRSYWADVPRSQVGITFGSQVLAVTNETGIAWWHAAFTRIAGGHHVKLNGVFVLTFDQTGLCTELREWWHRRED